MEGEIELTAADQLVDLNIAFLRQQQVLVTGFEARGVPLVAGEPYVTDFIFEVDQLGAPERITNRTRVTQGVSLPLSGAVTRHHFQTSDFRLLGKCTPDRLQRVQVRVRGSNGENALFTSLVVYFRVVDNRFHENVKVDLERPLSHALIAASAQASRR